MSRACSPTLDLMTGGRAAWNVVTSMNDGEALNMGQRRTAHDLRYDRADEFMEVVHGPLGRLGRRCDRPGQGDRASSRIPTRCTGWTTWAVFHSRGPFTVPRSAQGHPVIIQAGQSGRGRRFAARWAELVFVVYHAGQCASRTMRVQGRGIGMPGATPRK